MSNTITVVTNKRNKTFKIYSYHPLMENKEVIFESNKWGFSIRVLGLDDNKGLIVGQNGKGSFYVNAHCPFLKDGVYEVDEQDEDHISVNFKD